MKYGFKSKCKNSNHILRTLIFLTILLVISFTFFLLVNFNKRTNDNIAKLTEAEINRVIYSFITDKINNSVLNKQSLKDILVITKNKQDQILYVDFNLDQAYQVLDSVSNILNSSLKQLENGEVSVTYLDEQLSHKLNALTLSIPIGSTLNSGYFYNIGSKIPVKVNFIGQVLTNLKTKITNYGLNNALVEVFVYIEFKNQIILPFKTKEVNLKYDAVIASMMIEGEVPNFYNGVIEKGSSFYTKNIK